MENSGASIYSMEVGMQFLTQVFGYNGDGSLSRSNRIWLQDLTMLSEFQLHGTFVLRHHGPTYHIPEQFQPAADKFLAHRRFVGIVEKNMGTISLYLERFFFYLSSQGVKTIPQIMGEHAHGCLRFISGFSSQSKDHIMRTVRQFLEYCFQNGYHPEDLTNYAPVDYLKFGRPDSESGVVFLRHRPPFNEFAPGAIYSMVSGYIGKAGLLAAGKKRGPHALRHSLASRLLEENVPLPVISEILGHTDTNTTAVHLPIDIEQLRRCALEV